MNSYNQTQKLNLEHNLNRGSDSGRFIFNNLTDDLLEKIRPHVINLVQGQFSQHGDFKNDSTDVDMIFEENLVQALEKAKEERKKLHILFYAHGGVVNEQTALLQVAQHLDWWRDNHVYPIYFVWETGLLETIGQLLGIRRGQMGSRERSLFDGAIEQVARLSPAPLIWSGMKDSAEKASRKGSKESEHGGAYYAAKKLKEFCADHGKDVELHAVGHSAGSIFHAYFIPTVLDLAGKNFKTVNFLAPAVTVDLFMEKLFEPADKTGIDHLTIFTLRKQLEQQGSTAFYDKSILYLIHHSLEKNAEEPILGLEISIRQDSKLKRLLGIGRSSKDGEIVWASTGNTHEGRRASQATKHTDFNCDPATMNSVLRRILDVDDREEIVPYPTEASCENFDRSLSNVANIGVQNLNSNRSRNSTPSWNPASGSGRRRALCIGIDNYNESPLQGCVADAQLWGRTLKDIGFSKIQYLLNEEATQANISDYLHELIVTSQPGDVIVFQFAGHGTLLPDFDGDEVGRDTDQTDEALCPIDCNTGAFLIDDDLAELFSKIPAGVNLTCFMDCCHSGDSNRLFLGSGSRNHTGGGNERPRFIRPTSQHITEHRAFRERMGGRRFQGTRSQSIMREIAFFACRSHELAWESNGQGDFTSRATSILSSSGLSSLTNQQFIDEVVRTFGPSPRQNPDMASSPGASVQGLLQPIADATHSTAANGSIAPIQNREEEISQLVNRLAALLNSI